MSPKVDLERPIEILLVEDSPTDAALTQEAFSEGKIRNNLVTVVDGIEAMRYLRREDEYADAVKPDLVLLDLNLPRMDGREVLAAIRGDENLRSLVVVVLTTSTADADIAEAYRCNSNAYISKPVDLEQFFQIVRDIEHFYFSVVTLPRT